MKHNGIRNWHWPMNWEYHWDGLAQEYFGFESFSVAPMYKCWAHVKLLFCCTCCRSFSHFGRNVYLSNAHHLQIHVYIPTWTRQTDIEIYSKYCWIFIVLNWPSSCTRINSGAKRPSSSFRGSILRTSHTLYSSHTLSWMMESIFISCAWNSK